MAPTEWQPKREPVVNPWPMPKLGTAIWRGMKGQCPACGKSHLFNGYLRITKECTSCGAPLGLARADDAPPYFTIFVVGHIVVPLMLYIDRVQDLSVTAMAAIFVPLTLVLSLALLRPIKGGTVGLMVTLNMLKPDANRI